VKTNKGVRLSTLASKMDRQVCDYDGTVPARHNRHHVQAPFSAIQKATLATPISWSGVRLSSICQGQ